MISSIKKKIMIRVRFILSYFQFKKFLNKNINISENKKNEISNSYVFIISPWLLTPVPWFSIATAMLMQKRGHKIEFLIDDLEFEKKTDHKLQLKLIQMSLHPLRKRGVKIEILSKYNNDKIINNNEKLKIEKLAFANAIHHNKGEEDTTEFKSNYSKKEFILKRNFPYVKSYLEKNIEKTFILSGGIYANSGLFEFLLKTNNYQYFTFDSGFEVLMSSYKGIASQLTDIPYALELLLNQDENEKKKAINFANEEFEKRKNGTNKFNNQYQSFEESENFDEVGILIPLNSPWDSAALNIASVFNGYNEWLIETIGIILENSDFNITIRQHPDERFWWSKSSTDFNKLINKRYSNKRIQFVSCHDKVNSYALLMKSKAVICYSSTFGIEAAMADKKVCVCSHVYYSNIGFSYKPSNIDDIKYFLKNINSNEIKIEQEKAQLTYYLGQQCNWLFMPFTPMMPDLKKWISKSLEELSNDRKVNIYLNSLENYLPLSFVNHKEKKNEI